MGALDIEGKQYLSNNRIFADAFNFLLYDGDEVIKPDSLKELDTTGIAVPYGNKARVPEQKYRDLLKMWNAMMDENAIYVILGAEIQGEIHYGMPVKDALYDAIGYAKQIEECKRSYSKNGKDSSENNEAELTVEDDTLKIKLSSGEFLYGFHRDDKLIPIITAVVYLGDKSWDGPKSLLEMMEVKDERLLRFLNDYKINLISPVDMDEKEFKKFHTDLGLAMRVIKHQKEDADKVIRETDHRKIDRDTAFFLNRAVNLGLEYEEEKGGIDMCLAMEKKQKRDEINGVIKFLRMSGSDENDIIKKITETFDVTKEYVMALLAPQKA